MRPANSYYFPLSLSLSMSLLAVGACGDDSMKSSTSDIDPEIPCPSGNCGESRFRSAVPSRDTVRIKMDRASQRDLGLANPEAGIGSVHQALESISPALVDTEAYVQDINSSVEGLFESFESLASTEPELAEDNLHIWRGVSEDDAAFDEVLVVTAVDDLHYTIDLMVGPTGFDPASGESVVTGNVEIDGQEEKSDFDLTLDLDAASESFGGLGLTGQILISAQPFADGLREVWYDYDEVGEVGGDLESSRTTYWILDVNSGALEYLYDLHSESATVFVRWDDGGGRYDHHVAWEDEELGLVDELVTNCWDASGGELFDAIALIDSDLSYYGELDGEEGDCDFGPLEDHPSPGKDFVNLPGEGEWDDLEFGSEIVDAPLCALEPNDPECIPWCDDVPEDPDCLWYCDEVDDPEFCG